MNRNMDFCKVYAMKLRIWKMPSPSFKQIDKRIITKLIKMNIKAATSQQQIKLGSDLITINGVKGDALLFRVMINNTFKGYIQKREGEYYRLDGSDIHNLIFARICHAMETPVS